MRGSARVLYVELNHSLRLQRLENEFFIYGDRFVQLAKQICGFGKNKAYKLLKLAPHYYQVIEWVEAEKARIGARGEVFTYPSWNQCLNKFSPKQVKEKDDTESEESEESEETVLLAGDLPEETDDNLAALNEIHAASLAAIKAERDEALAKLAEACQEIKTLKDQRQEVRMEAQRAVYERDEQIESLKRESRDWRNEAERQDEVIRELESKLAALKPESKKRGRKYQSDATEGQPSPFVDEMMRRTFGA